MSEKSKQLGFTEGSDASTDLGIGVAVKTPPPPDWLTAIFDMITSLANPPVAEMSEEPKPVIMKKTTPTQIYGVERTDILFEMNDTPGIVPQKDYSLYVIIGLVIYFLL